ncbi:unnamed protein product, partial [Closterium sp. NIES-53]
MLCHTFVSLLHPIQPPCPALNVHPALTIPSLTTILWSLSLSLQSLLLPTSASLSSDTHSARPFPSPPSPLLSLIPSLSPHFHPIPAASPIPSHPPISSPSPCPLSFPDPFCPASPLFPPFPPHHSIPTVFPHPLPLPLPPFPRLSFTLSLSPFFTASPSYVPLPSSHPRVAASASGSRPLPYPAA